MTINDIAAHLGISIATVSKALNGSTDISSETKKTVCDYAQTVGYRSRKSQSIVGRIALFEGELPYDGELARAFCGAAEQARYVVERTAFPAELDFNNFFAENRFAGGFLVGCRYFPELIAAVESSRYPLVLADCYCSSNPLVAGVGSDHLRAAKEAVDYFVSCGHTEIAFLGKKNSLVDAERLAGYTLGLSVNGLPLCGERILNEPGALPDGVTALLCTERLERSAVPPHCAVAVFDPAEEENCTAIKQDFVRVGKLAFSALADLINGATLQRAIIPYPPSSPQK